MSYDLHAFPLRPGEDPSEAYERLEEEEEAIEGGADVRALVEALVTAVPALTRTASGDEEEDADEDVELTSQELQVLVSTGSVAISIPYWRDPQLERLVESGADLDEAVAAVAAGAAALGEFVDGGA